MKRQALAIFIISWAVLGVVFGATPQYSPLPTDGTIDYSFIDPFQNVSFASEFRNLNDKADEQAVKISALSAKIDQQRDAFIKLADREEVRFLQAEAIKRSDERINSQLKGFKLYTLLSVTFLTLLAVFLFRKTLDEFKNQMKKEIKKEVELDLRNQIRIAVLPDGKKQKGKDVEEEAQIIGQRIIDEAVLPDPPKKVGLFGKLFGRFKRKSKEEKAVAEIANIREQVRGNSPTPAQAQQAVWQAPQPIAPQRTENVTKTLEAMQAQIQSLLAQAAPPQEVQSRPKPRRPSRAKRRPAPKPHPAQPQKQMVQPAQTVADIPNDELSGEDVEVELEKK